MLACDSGARKLPAAPENSAHELLQHHVTVAHSPQMHKSILPNFSIASCTAALRVSGFRTSAAAGMHRRPVAFSNSFAASARRSAFRPTMTASAPCRIFQQPSQHTLLKGGTSTSVRSSRPCPCQGQTLVHSVSIVRGTKLHIRAPPPVAKITLPLKMSFA